MDMETGREGLRGATVHQRKAQAGRKIASEGRGLAAGAGRAASRVAKSPVRPPTPDAVPAARGRSPGAARAGDQGSRGSMRSPDVPVPAAGDVRPLQTPQRGRSAGVRWSEPAHGRKPGGSARLAADAASLFWGALAHPTSDEEDSVLEPEPARSATSESAGQKTRRTQDRSSSPSVRRQDGEDEDVSRSLGTKAQIAQAFSKLCPPALSAAQLKEPLQVARWLRLMAAVCTEFETLLPAVVLRSEVVSRLPMASPSTGASVDELLSYVRNTYCPAPAARYLVQRFRMVTNRSGAVQQYLVDFQTFMEDVEACGVALPDDWSVQALLEGLRCPEAEALLNSVDQGSWQKCLQQLRSPALAAVIARCDNPGRAFRPHGFPPAKSSGSQHGRQGGGASSEAAGGGMGTSVGGSVSSAVGGTSSAGSAATMQARRTSGACFNCGSTEHRAKACPKGSGGSVKRITVVGDGAGRYVWLPVGPAGSVGMLKMLADTGATTSVVPSYAVDALGLTMTAPSTDDPEAVALYGAATVPIIGTVKVPFGDFGDRTCCVIAAAEEDAALYPAVLGRDVAPSMWVQDHRCVINDKEFPAEDGPAGVRVTAVLTTEAPSDELDGYLSQQAPLGFCMGKQSEAEAVLESVMLPTAAEFLAIGEGDAGAIAAAAAHLTVERKHALPALKGVVISLPMKAELTDRPIAVRSRFVHPDTDAHITAEVQELCRLGVMEPSTSLWCSRLVSVPKSDGGRRLVVDYRAVNECIRDEPYPMPIVSDLLLQLRGSRYFGKLDCKSGYFQLALDEVSRKYTAVDTKEGRFQFCRLPQGVNCAPRIFQRVMRTILDGVPNVLVFIDDVVIHGATWSQYLDTLYKVLRRFEDVGLTLNGGKCVFAACELKVLGHVVSEVGVSPDPEKVAAFVRMPSPSSKSEVRQWVGCAGWYRRFVADFASIVAPLTHLLKETTVFEWTAECETAVVSLRKAMVESVPLMHPAFDEPFILRCDASGVGLGGVLCQRTKEDALRPVAYYSRQFNVHERRYDVRERELLALVSCVKHWELFLLPRPFVIHTDHRNLVWLFKDAHLTGRLARWALLLQSFVFSVVHVPGTSLPDADLLSRVFALRGAKSMKSGSAAEGVRALPGLDEIRAAQEGDTSIRHITHVATVTLDGVLFAGVAGKRVPIIPTALRPTFVQVVHDSHGHPGAQRTLQRLRTLAYWPGMTKDVARFVKACVPCMKTKPSRDQGAGFMGQIPVSAPWQLVALDIVGPLPNVDGFRHLLTIQDRFSRWCALVPLKHASAECVAEGFVSRWVANFGVPDKVLSDRGGAFIGSVFSLVARRLGVEQLRTSAYHPATNGGLERLHRTLVSLLTHLQGETAWPQQIPFVQLVLNSSVCESTGVTPSFSVFGRELQLPLDTVTLPTSMVAADAATHGVRIASILQEVWRVMGSRAEASHERNARRVNDSRHEAESFPVGSFVFVFEPANQRKFGHRWTGPYRVKTVVSSGLAAVVEVVQTGAVRTVHVDRMRRAPMHALDAATVVDADFVDVTPDGSPDWCHLCGDGGLLLICDQCNRSFHHDCVGLRKTPAGHWYCQSCKIDRSGVEAFIPKA